jgi:hypothetical protein
MTARKKPQAVLRLPRPSDMKGEQKAIGGSMSDDWNVVVANQVINTIWTKHLDDGDADRLRTAAVEALMGIKPQGEIEGMFGAQLIACHLASMECYRRAMLPDQSLEVRHSNLNSANKLSRTYSSLLEALNRHRGNAPGAAMSCTDTARRPVPVTRDEKWSLPDARRPVAGRAERK